MDVVRPPTSESKTIETTPRKPKVKKQSKHGNKMEGRKNAKEEEMDLKTGRGIRRYEECGRFFVLLFLFRSTHALSRTPQDTRYW